MANELTFHSTACTGDTLYLHVENNIGQVWNGSAFEAPVSGSWANYDIAMTEQATSTGIFRASMPAAAAGAYSFVVRQQAGGSPAVTDIVLAAGWIQWGGTSEIPLSELDAVLAGVTNTDTANEVAFKDRSGTERRRIVFGSADGSRTASTVS